MCSLSNRIMLHMIYFFYYSLPFTPSSHQKFRCLIFRNERLNKPTPEGFGELLFPIIWNYPFKSYFPKKRGLFAIYVSFCSNKNVISEAILEENVLKKDFSQKLYNFL